jgi:hypothetical protein
MQVSKRDALALAAVAFLAITAREAGAQAPPPLPLFVLDLHGAVTNFPDDPALASSRGLTPAQLPGLGLGGDIAVQLYPVRLGPMTLGLGGRLVVVRGRQASAQTASVSERFTYLGPQLSFNFGSGDGWSYLSGGIAGSTWSLVPNGAVALPGDDERLQTIDYGGGARWFARPHLAFSFDVRLYAINPGTPAAGLPGSPRTTLLVFGAGVSVK